MTVRDDLETVVNLACLIEDRTDNEQRALLRVARRVDKESNANVIRNRRMWGAQAGFDGAERQMPLSDLEGLAEETRVLVDNQREVHLKGRRTGAAS